MIYMKGKFKIKLHHTTGVNNGINLGSRINSSISLHPTKA